MAASHGATVAEGSSGRSPPSHGPLRFLSGRAAVLSAVRGVATWSVLRRALRWLRLGLADTPVKVSRRTDADRPNSDAAMEALTRCVLDPAHHDLLAIVKGARNGLVYGAKIRFPHALVMSLLFRSGRSVGGRSPCESATFTLTHAGGRDRVARPGRGPAA